MNNNEVINLYKQAFPQTEHEADAGYIFPDGTIIDISSTGYSYCHGKEFIIDTNLAEWRNAQTDLPRSNRLVADFVMDKIGAIEFTISNCNLQCIRLPKKQLTATQKTKLLEIVSRILERGFVRVEVLGTDKYKVYMATDYTATEVLGKINTYYASGNLPD
jgi:hypothetical protein